MRKLESEERYIARTAKRFKFNEEDLEVVNKGIDIVKEYFLWQYKPEQFKDNFTQFFIVDTVTDCARMAMDYKN